MPELIPPGWLPIDITCDPPEPKVTWLDFGVTKCSEPFFIQTVTRLQAMRPPRPERITGLDTLLRRASTLPPIVPAGVIFHISRCGSTLVANAMRAGKDTLVLSEPRVFARVTGPGFFHKGCVPPEHRDNTRRLLLDALIRIYGFHEGHAQPNCVIKWVPFGIMQIDLIRSLWPTVPFLVLIRDPVEVMASNLTRPPAACLWDNPLKRLDEESCAREIGLLCAAARNYLDDQSMLLDYEQLNLEAMHSIARFFGITLMRSQLPSIDLLTGKYSKDPMGGQYFVDDRNAKQNWASPLVKLSAERWAKEAYLTLRSLVSRPHNIRCVANSSASATIASSGE